jgi:hypothetical protein
MFEKIILIIKNTFKKYSFTIIFLKYFNNNKKILLKSFSMYNAESFGVKRKIFYLIQETTISSLS